MAKELRRKVRERRRIEELRTEEDEKCAKTGTAEHWGIRAHAIPHRAHSIAMQQALFRACQEPVLLCIRYLTMISIALFLLFYCPVRYCYGSMTPSIPRTDPLITSTPHPRHDPRIQLTESYIFFCLMNPFRQHSCCAAVQWCSGDAMTSVG